MSFYDWISNTNNPSLPKSEYLYGTRHIIVLCITAFLCILLTFIFQNKSKKAKQILLYVLGSIFLFFEITSRIVNLCIEDQLSLKKVFEIIIPMHVCSVMVWVLIVAIFTKKQFLFNFASIGGLIATLAFLLYPAVGLNRTYMSFTCIYSTFTHMLGFITAILLITLGFTDFNFKNIWQTFLCFGIMFLWGILLDFVILPGSDYMYLVNDPLNLELTFPYQILYGIILILYITSFYLCSYITKKIKVKFKKI